MLSADVKRFRSDLCKLRKTSNNLFAKVVRVRKLADLLATYAKTAESYGTEAQRILAESPSPSISFWCLSRPDEAKQLRLLTEEVMRSRKEYGTLASLREVEELVLEEKSAVSQALTALRDFINLHNEMFAVPEEDRLEFNGAEIGEDVPSSSVAHAESPKHGSGESCGSGSSSEIVERDRKKQLDERMFQVEDLLDLVQLKQAELESQCDASVCECQGWIERFLFFTRELQRVVDTLLEVERNDAKRKAFAIEDDEATTSGSDDESNRIDPPSASPQEQERQRPPRAPEPERHEKRLCCRSIIAYLDAKVQQCSGMDVPDRDDQASPRCCGPLSERSSALSVPFPPDDPNFYDSAADTPSDDDETAEELDSSATQQASRSTSPALCCPPQPRDFTGRAIVPLNDADADHHVFPPERLADDTQPSASPRSTMSIHANPPAKQCLHDAPALLRPKKSTPSLLRFFMPNVRRCWFFLP